MICDRVSLTCEAIQYTGLAEPIALFIGKPLLARFDRHILVNPSGSVWRYLDRGDWIVKGVGPEWDFYVIPDLKFRRLWKPRAH